MPGPGLIFVQTLATGLKIHALEIGKNDEVTIIFLL